MLSSVRESWDYDKLGKTVPTDDQDEPDEDLAKLGEILNSKLFAAYFACLRARVHAFSCLMV